MIKLLFRLSNVRATKVRILIFSFDFDFNVNKKVILIYHHVHHNLRQFCVLRFPLSFKN